MGEGEGDAAAVEVDAPSAVTVALVCVKTIVTVLGSARVAPEKSWPKEPAPAAVAGGLSVAVRVSVVPRGAT
jgi:hypothetical protein